MNSRHTSRPHLIGDGRSSFLMATSFLLIGETVWPSKRAILSPPASSETVASRETVEPVSLVKTAPVWRNYCSYFEKVIRSDDMDDDSHNGNGNLGTGQSATQQNSHEKKLHDGGGGFRWASSWRRENDLCICFELAFTLNPSQFACWRLASCSPSYWAAYKSTSYFGQTHLGLPSISQRMLEQQRPLLVGYLARHQSLFRASLVREELSFSWMCLWK